MSVILLDVNILSNWKVYNFVKFRSLSALVSITFDVHSINKNSADTMTLIFLIKTTWVHTFLYFHTLIQWH